MTNNHFEKRIQEKLNQFEIEPSENLFNHILEKRASRSKSFFKFTYAKAAVAILAAVAVTVLVVVNQSPITAPKVSTTTMAVSEKPVSNVAPSSHAKQATTSSVAESKQPMSKKVKEVVADNGQAKENKLKTSKTTSKVKSSTVPKVNSNEVKVAVSAPSAKVKSKSNPSKEFKNTNSGLSTYSGYQDNGVNITDRYFNIDSKDRPMIAGQRHQGKSHLYVYHSVDEQLINSKDLSFLVLKPLSVSKPETSLEQLAAIDKKEIKADIKKQVPVFIDLYYSALLTKHGVSGNNGLAPNYKSLSVVNTNQAFNVRVSVPVATNINVFTGFGFNQLNTQFNGTIPNTTGKVHYETNTYFINDPITGQPTPVQKIDTILNGPVAYQFANHYKLMQIPIGLSYNMGFKRFDLAIHGAAVMNITTKARGINPNFDLENMNEFNSSQKHLGIGTSISLMVAYKLSNKLRLIAEPGVQYFKINAKKNGNAVNENIFNTGMSLGLRYTIF